MKLEVGMYVRTINNKAVGNGVIGRIKYINERDFNGKQKKYYSVWTNNKNWFEIGSASEVKSSNNIIDLIEVGDYVNGHLVTATYNPNGDEMYHISLQNGKDYILIHNDDEIKSILTHEQYEANCYKVAE